MKTDNVPELIAPPDAIYRPYAYMAAYADGLARTIAPVCERVAIGGSLRRKRPMIRDIELIAIGQPDRNLLGEPYYENGGLERLMATWPITYLHNGARNKRFAFQERGKPGEYVIVDLYLAQPDNWGYILMLRTGSAGFTKRMVTPKYHGGLKPDRLTLKNGYVLYRGETVPIDSEERLFELWEMDYIEPAARV